MEDINLSVGSGDKRKFLSDVSRFVKSGNVLFTIVFFVTFLVIISLIIINQQNIDAAIREEEEYKKKLNALSETELRYNILKDRVEKSSKIFEERSTLKKMEDLSLIFKDSNQVVLSGLKIDSKGFSLSASAPDFESLKYLLSFLKSLNYEFGSIDNLSFSSDKGYTLDVVFH